MELLDSLDGFLDAVEYLCDGEPATENVNDEESGDEEIVQAPKLDTAIFSNFRLLMKSSPRNKEMTKVASCKKCELTKKRLEEKIEKLEERLLFQQDQLFEAYSHLNARVDIIEEKERK